MAFESGLFNTREPASWEQGDWDGAPSDGPQPPDGNGVFDDADLIHAFLEMHYRTGAYAPDATESIDQLAPLSANPDAEVQLTYDASNGGIQVVSSVPLTTLSIESESRSFLNSLPNAFTSLYDVGNSHEIFVMPPREFTSANLGVVSKPGLDASFFYNDLRANATREGGGFAELFLSVCDECVEPIVNTEPATPLIPGEEQIIPGQFEAGDANLDFFFDQHDIIHAFKAGKYETGATAKWSEGDWDGEASVGVPSIGNGRFDDDDLAAAYRTQNYGIGPYNVNASQPMDELSRLSDSGPADATLSYDPSTGGLLFESTVPLTTLSLESLSENLFGPQPVGIITGDFDLRGSSGFFILRPESFTGVNLGLMVGDTMTKSEMLDDLRIDGSLLGGGGLGTVEFRLCDGCTDSGDFLLGVPGAPVPPIGASATIDFQYDSLTGEILLSAAPGPRIRAVHILSETGIFTGPASIDLVLHDAHVILWTDRHFGANPLYLGAIAEPGLTEDDLLDDIDFFGGLNGFIRVGSVDYTVCAGCIDDPGPPPPDYVVGDSNLDSYFDSADLIQAFKAGEFEDGILNNSTWEEGAWTEFDGDFTALDLQRALEAGYYGTGAYNENGTGPIHHRSALTQGSESDVVVTYQANGTLLVTSTEPLTTFHLFSESQLFLEGHLPGSFDLFGGHDLFDLIDPPGARSFEFPKALPINLSCVDLLSDLSIDGSRTQGGGLGTAVLNCTGGERPSTAGDFNHDLFVDELDIDLLCQEVRRGKDSSFYDANEDGLVDGTDVEFLTSTILQTSIGDTNLDGVFDSRDLVLVFVAGAYEDLTAENVGWAEGDWNCDGRFDSADIVAAFTKGAYSKV